MRYDILEYFSIYGTALSIWVSLMGKHRSLKLPPQHHPWQVGQDLSPSLVGWSVGETPRNAVAFELPSARLSSETGLLEVIPCYGLIYFCWWGLDTHKNCPEWWLGEFGSLEINRALAPGDFFSEVFLHLHQLLCMSRQQQNCLFQIGK